PNRDSTSYIKTYGFDDRVKTIFRGTLRNLGHCKLYRQLIALGLLENEPKQSFAGKTYRQVLESLVGAPAEKTIPEKLGTTGAESPLDALRCIGMLSDEPVTVEDGSIMDVLAERMAVHLAYREGERDMLLMRHDMDFELPGGARERVTAIMVEYGIPGGDSSMARTVSLPAAIGVHLLCRGKISLRGVQIPVKPEIYEPVLGELESLGIGFSETVSPL
ncbi:MAG: saccharopine dehydrogenase, partial [Deltaproteobacteria bacterium]